MKTHTCLVFCSTRNSTPPLPPVITDASQGGWFLQVFHLITILNSVVFIFVTPVKKSLQHLPFQPFAPHCRLLIQYFNYMLIIIWQEHIYWKQKDCYTCKWYNTRSLTLIGVQIVQWLGQNMARIMTCFLFGANLLFRAMIVCPSDTEEQT